MKPVWLALLAASCLTAGHALAESPGASLQPSNCPVAGEIRQHHLLGLWRASFEGPGQRATLLLEQHPELADSVRGAINRGGERALVAGDVDDGEFTLEESVDGVRISATWSGSVIDGSCGREIRGDWQGATGSAARRFVLKKD